MKMILLPALLLSLWGEAARCLEEGEGFTFDSDIRHFAVANNTVYIATEERLYQLNHDLTLVQSLTQRGVLTAEEHEEGTQFVRVSETDQRNATFGVNILLPFVENDTLISCGVIDKCGYCEVRDLKNISNLLHREHIPLGSPWRSSASLGFLVSVEKTRPETFILAATEQREDKSTKTPCSTGTEAVRLHNTNNNQGGGIFAKVGEYSQALIRLKGNVTFVDGFQVNSNIYLFSNLPPSNKVRLIWLEGKDSKDQTARSLRGATLRLSDGDKAHRLLASSVIPGGPPVLWSGVFSVDGGQTNTELAVFDITPDLTENTDEDPDFCSTACSDTSKRTPKTLKPKTILFRQNYMTSVLALRQKAWMVFFIGTADGHLIKLAVDKNYRTACPRVLYRANGDRQVLPKIHLDQVDVKHVYVPFQNQMKRVPVSKCSTYTTVQDCWSARDPYCVWCSSKSSCTFEDDCKNSDSVFIPDDSQQKMVSYKVVKNSAGQITLNIQTHLTVGKRALSTFTCEFSASQLCSTESPPPQFPQCTCILSDRTLPPEGLAVPIRIRLGTTQLLEQVNLTNCTDIEGPPTSVLCQQCIDAGCGWHKNGCSWATAGTITKALEDLAWDGRLWPITVSNSRERYLSVSFPGCEIPTLWIVGLDPKALDSVCQMMESGLTFSKPEISSISPSVTSFYGRNHAVLSGNNLTDVTKVRIQADMDCTPQESPVWNNTGVNLTFHIPRASIKGVVKVCAVLPDGSCHGSAEITYQSSPSCTNITPSSSWVSGKRKITVIGSHLELVEGVIHSHALQDVRPLRNSNFQNLTYDTPAAENNRNFPSSLFLKVANETLACSTTISYYPDPEFIGFTPTRIRDDVHITIEKKADKLNITMAELSVWGVQDGKQYPCIMEDKETHNKSDFFFCKIQRTPDSTFQHLMIAFGDKMVTLGTPSLLLQALLTLRMLLIPFVIFVLVIMLVKSKEA